MKTIYIEPDFDIREKVITGEITKILDHTVFHEINEKRDVRGYSVEYVCTPRYEIGKTYAITKRLCELPYTDEEIVAELQKEIPDCTVELYHDAQLNRNLANDEGKAKMTKFLDYAVEIKNAKLIDIKDISHEECLQLGIYKEGGKYTFSGSDGFFGDSPKIAFMEMYSRMYGEYSLKRNDTVFLYDIDVIRINRNRNRKVCFNEYFRLVDAATSGKMTKFVEIPYEKVYKGIQEEFDDNKNVIFKENHQYKPRFFVGDIINIEGTATNIEITDIKFITINELCNLQESDYLSMGVIKMCDFYTYHNGGKFKSAQKAYLDLMDKAEELDTFEDSWIMFLYTFKTSAFKKTEK